MLKLNIGCGETKLEGFVNIDIEEATKPDLVADLSKGPLLYEGETVDEILCIHNIEHIKFSLWPLVFAEFYRLLKPDGLLHLEYPEFEKCAKYFIDNHRGQRDYWRNTLYGRQLYPGDYHISPVITGEIAFMLQRRGFHKFKSMPGPGDGNECYTVLICRKGFTKTKEDILREEIFTGIQK